MSEIQGIGGIQGPKEVQPKRGGERPAPTDAASRPERSDSVEISGKARIRSQIDEVPDIRFEKVEAIRQAIRDGDYMSEQKLRDAVDRLLDDIL